MTKITIKHENIHPRTVGMLLMLGLQFLLGVLLTFVGKDATGATAVFGIFVLAFHVLIAIGLLINGTLLAYHYKDPLARWGAWVIALTILSGLLTVVTASDVFSFLMAIGFLAASGIYVRLYMHTINLTRPPHPA
jgi:hypothetical protein